MKIHPVGAELFHAGRWMVRQMTKLIVTFHNSANCLKMNFKIKHTIILEGITLLPSVVPVCELLEQMTENAKSKIIPGTQPCFSKSIHRC